ncbi:leucine-rich repeat domain-containing protein [uncultured Alistipes sp.]|uniref:leucine-rich repeat domain-containing protein n=1 Tax=uncultured Alistipes sp. TaxID=538949 RepID=UPI0025AFC7F7|nr:leucine-rich repeat domain-containing protein [uncultured Alistipes sp.]
MKKLFLLTALFVAAAFPSCSKHDGVETPDWPDPQPLAIAFVEGSSLEFDVGETKTVHYTITGGSANNVVKVEMQNPDDTYTVETTPISATEGTITITAKKPSNENRIIVTVSDDSQTLTAEIAVSTKPNPEELAITFAEGNLLLLNINEPRTIHYTITGGSAKTVVTAEMQNPDDAYTVETTPISATEGTITITAKKPSNENRIIVTVSDDSQTLTAEIAVSTKPNPEELAITFAEGNLLLLNINEPRTIHYTITGGSAKTVVTAEMQNPDDAYTVETTPISATEGTITITAKKPSNENCVIVTVSDGNRSITAKIDVTLKASFDGKTAVVVTPGSLSKLLADYVQTRITQLTVIGNLNDKDIVTLKNLPNLAILDMENANLEALPAKAFYKNTSLTSVKLPRMLKTIGNSAFEGCSGLTSVTIPGGVTSVGWSAFYRCSSLTSITIPDSVTTIGESAFSNCGFDWITIGSSVTTIWGNTFDDCHASSISCKAQTPPTIATISTGAYWYKWTLYVPIGCKKAYAAAQYWKGAEAIREKKFE